MVEFLNSALTAFIYWTIKYKQKLIIFVLILLFFLVLIMSKFWFSERFSETIKIQSDLRASRYSSAISNELKKNQIIPFLLAQDPSIITSLKINDFSKVSDRLTHFGDEIGLGGLKLMDRNGNLVASSTLSEVKGTALKSIFRDLLPSDSSTIFKVVELENNKYQFTYFRLILDKEDIIGMIALDVDLNQFEERWRSPVEAIMIIDSSGKVVISTEKRWKGKDIREALLLEGPKTVLNRAFKLAGGYLELNNSNDFIKGETVLRTEINIPYNGWKLISFLSYSGVRERVNAVLAIEIMIFAIIAAFIFYKLNRRAQSQALKLKKESEELRALNLRLNKEVSIREKVQETLEVAEQSLVQSQKLAVLGEMSAAVSHELNQPLAAMRTYLAAAKLLFDRRRTDEAQASLQRIDDLIERMGVITKQLKLHARKVGVSLEKIDLRDVVTNSLAIMEPNLKQNSVEIELSLGDNEVLVVGDPIRLEQVVINLIRNSLDATSSCSDPKISISIVLRHTAALNISDNGTGIEELDNIFEPFFTTKEPGDGLGLGLSISSSIIKDYGGRLTARNNELSGATFEFELPLLKEDEMIE